MKRRLIIEISVTEGWDSEGIYAFPGLLLVTAGKLLEALPGLKVDYIKSEPINEHE